MVQLKCIGTREYENDKMKRLNFLHNFTKINKWLEKRNNIFFNVSKNALSRYSIIMYIDYYYDVWILSHDNVLVKNIIVYWIKFALPVNYNSYYIYIPSANMFNII